MSIGLAMMAGPEQATVGRLLDSLEGFCDPDRSTVLCVAGDDGTAEACADWGAEVHHSGWVDFETGLNELFSLARGRADYLFHVGATDIVSHQGAPGDLGGPSYMIEQRKEDMSFLMPCLLSGSEEWHWSGVVHSYVEPLQVGRPTLAGVSVLLADDDGRRPEKLERYRAMLERAVAAEPSNARNVFYLAQTYRNLGLAERAIEWYERRASMGGFEEERWNAQYWAATLTALFVNWNQAVPMLLSCWHARPGRAEPLRMLAETATAFADQIPYPADEILFVQRECYR